MFAEFFRSLLPQSNSFFVGYWNWWDSVAGIVMALMIGFLLAILFQWPKKEKKLIHTAAFLFCSLLFFGTLALLSFDQGGIEGKRKIEHLSDGLYLVMLGLQESEQHAFLAVFKIGASGPENIGVIEITDGKFPPRCFRKEKSIINASNECPQHQARPEQSPKQNPI